MTNLKGIALPFLLAFSLMHFPFSESSWFINYHIHIRNDLPLLKTPPETPNLFLDCKSLGKDVGDKLMLVKQDYTWDTKINFARSTHFYCIARWVDHKEITFDAFRAKRDESRCKKYHNSCMWSLMWCAHLTHKLNQSKPHSNNPRRPFGHGGFRRLEPLTMKPNGGCKAHAAVNNISRNKHHPTIGSKDLARGSKELIGGGGDDTIHVLVYRIRSSFRRPITATIRSPDGVHFEICYSRQPRLYIHRWASSLKAPVAGNYRGRKVVGGCWNGGLG
ncbi:hypothetical protein GQ457_05G011830 [Hibiscus cannabinus]